MKRNNMPNMRLYLVLFYAFFYAGGLFSQAVYQNPDENVDIGKFVYFLEDKGNDLTIEQVAKDPGFKQSASSVQNFGITASAIWLRLTVVNKTNIGNLILQVNQPIIDAVEFYAYDNTKQA